VVNPADYFNVPEGAQTVVNLAEKNQDGMFELEISWIKRVSPDTIRFTLKFPNPNWILGCPTAMHLMICKPP